MECMEQRSVQPLIDLLALVAGSWRTATKACEMLMCPPSTVCIFGLSCCHLLLCGRWMLSLRVACLSGWGQNCCIRCFYLPNLFFPIIFPYYHEVTFPLFGAQSTCVDFDFHVSIRRIGCWWTPNHFLPFGLQLGRVLGAFALGGSSVFDQAGLAEDSLDVPFQSEYQSFTVSSMQNKP